MKSKLFLLLFVIILPAEIFAQRAISDDILKKYYSYQRPKSKFKFAKKQNIAKLKALEALPVDTNAVYVSGVFNLYEKDTFYTYTRFFSNGEVFISYDYKSVPTEQECNDLSYGKWGMYSMEGNDLILEIYVSGFPSRYWYNYIKVEGNKLKYYKRIIGKWNKSTEPLNLVEEKKPVNLTNFKINWQ